MHPPDTFGSSVANLALFGALLLVVLFGVPACDTSENDTLLNPPLSDSIVVNVVNLIPDAAASVSLDETNVAQDLETGFVSSDVSYFSRENVDLFIDADGATDTVANFRIPQERETEPRLTLFAVERGLDSGRTLYGVQSVLTSILQVDDLMASGSGRVYVINGIQGSLISVREGCPAGNVAVSPLSGPGTRTLDRPAGDHSLFVIDESDSTRLGSARIDLEAGEIGALIIAEVGGVRQLFYIEIGAAIDTKRMLSPAQEETRSEATIRLLNMLDNQTIDATHVQGGEVLAQDLPSLGISSAETFMICEGAAGDSVDVVIDDADTVRTGFAVDVGSEVLAAVYRDRDVVRVAVLQTNVPGINSGDANVRAINLSGSFSPLSFVVGAGAPGVIAAGDRLFRSLPIGTTTDYKQVASGLYPLSLESSITGAWYEGGLQRFDAGQTLLIVSDDGDRPHVYVYDERAGGTSVQPFASSGFRAHLFNLIPERLASLDLQTSLGTLAVDSLGYSYVFSTVVPKESITVANAGPPPDGIDFTLTGHTIGLTGTNDNPELLHFPLPADEPPNGMAHIRFLNAVPGSGSFEILRESDGSVVSTAAYGTPTSPIEREPRRYTFTVRRNGTADTVARISGVAVGEDRSYLLIVGPKGATSSGEYPYGTLWMQE